MQPAQVRVTSTVEHARRPGHVSGQQEVAPIGASSWSGLVSETQAAMKIGWKTGEQIK
jgi:hypothetical protein